MSDLKELAHSIRKLADHAWALDQRRTSERLHSTARELEATLDYRTEAVERAFVK